MGRILAGFRLVFKTVGMQIENREAHTLKLDLERSPIEHPRAFVYFGSKPPWGGVDVASVPAFGSPGERVPIRLESPVGQETGDSSTMFAAVMVEKEFDVDDALSSRWFANPDDAINDVHSAIGEEVRTELEPRALTLVAALAARFSQGALAERVWEGVFYHVTEEQLRVVFGRGLVRIFDYWIVTDENIRRNFANLTFPLLPDRIFPVAELLQRVGLAAHWLVVASGERSPANRFMAHFLVLETLSSLASDLPAPNSLPAPWKEREGDFKELARLAKAAGAPAFLQRIAERLSGTRYTEPSLAEGFDRLVDLHPGEMKDSNKPLFRRLSQIRNDLLHGRISEPPSILEADSPTSALEDLALSAMRAVLASVAGMTPGHTVEVDTNRRDS